MQLLFVPLAAASGHEQAAEDQQRQRSWLRNQMKRPGKIRLERRTTHFCGKSDRQFGARSNKELTIKSAGTVRGEREIVLVLVRLVTNEKDVACQIPENEVP